MAEQRRPAAVEAKRANTETGHPDLNIKSPRELTGLNRSMFCHQPAAELPLNLLLRPLIDVQYTKTSFHGYPKMSAHPRRARCQVNPKRMQRLMRLTDVRAAYLKHRQR